MPFLTTQPGEIPTISIVLYS